MKKIRPFIQIRQVVVLLMTVALFVNNWMPETVHASERMSLPEIAGSEYHSNKVVLDFEWSAPSAAYLSRHITSMENSGYFDGIVFYPGSRQTYLFQPGYWSDSNAYIDHKSLDNIQWNKWKKKSFLLLWSGDEWNNNYWDDVQWNQILYNMEKLGQAVKEADCAGIFFDTEPYSDRNPWSFENQNNGHSLEETRAIVRQRGEQVMRAWEKYDSDISILGTFVSLIGTKEDDLLPSFVNGMLDGLTKKARLIDGNENTYNYTQTGQFYEFKAERKRNGSEFLWGELDPVNRQRWRTQVQIANAVYWDRWMGTNPSKGASRQWVHNIFTALNTTDQYVWVYTERMNWFNIPTEDQPMGNCVEQTGINSRSDIRLIEAEDRFKANKSLGYDMATWSDYSHFVQWNNLRCSIKIHDYSKTIRTRDTVVINLKSSWKRTPSDIDKTEVFVNGLLYQSYPHAKKKITINGWSRGKYDIIVRVTDANGETATSNRLQLKVKSQSN